MDFKILNRDTVYRGRAFRVEKVLLELPNLKQRYYDLVDHNNSVTILPIDEFGNVFFVTQYRLGSNGQLLELPAGVVEDQEEPEICALREIQEEIGMAAKNLDFLGDFYLAAGYSTEHMYTYLATNLYSSALNPDADEFLNVSKIPFKEVLEMMREGKIKDAKTLATLALAIPLIKLQE